MTLLAKACLVLLALSGASFVFCQDELPDFCKGIQCPRFTVIKATKDYEVRKYKPSTWAVTSEEGMDFSLTRRLMFFRLIDYIRGRNEKKQRIEMTVPVLAKIAPGPGPACPNNFTMGFYMEPKVAPTAPKPENPAVQLVKLPEQVFYVKSFGGQASIEDFVEKTAELAKVLPPGTRFDRSHFYRAQFDDPSVPFDRHNEVWLTAL